jgi:aspartate kinase
VFLVNIIVVVKFGGSCLSTPDNILTAAKKIAVEAASGKSVVVVVSALGGETDKLISLAQGSTVHAVSKEDLDEILSMGERTMVRLLATALKSQGVTSIAIDPTSSLWPVYTDSAFGSATVDLDDTKQAVTDKLLPLLAENCVPVVAGFLGRSPDGKITTLGRGGSDVSAVILGRCLDAGEVIFVKDVEGVFSADPKRIIDPQKIDFLEAEEAYSLVSAGARVIHPKALTYKQNSMNLRVVGFNAHDLRGGTLITGEVQADLEVQLRPTSLSMITLIALKADSLNVLLSLLTDALPSNTTIMGLALTSSSLLLYVENASRLVLSLHDMIKTQGLAKAIHCIDSVAMIEVSGFNLEQIPGVVDVVVSPLAREEINLYGVLTISSSIKIFVPWNERETTLSLINEQLRKFKNQEEK